MIAFVAFGIFMLSLNTTGKKLDKLIEAVQPPPGVILIERSGFRGGLICFYKFPQMNDEEVRLYYKKELIKKNGYIKKKINSGIMNFYKAK